MRYILRVMALLEASDVTNNYRHLGFYQELEIRLKSRKIHGNFVFLSICKIAHKVEKNVFSLKNNLTTCY